MPRGTHPNSLANLKKGNRFTKETARREGKRGAEVSNAVQKQNREQGKTLAELAKIVGRAKIKKPKIIAQLKELGIEDEDLTNDALVLAAVFQAAIHGDLKAVDKWEDYIGQSRKNAAESKDGQLADLIDGLREPCEYDLYEETAGFDGAMADEPTETH